MMSFTVAKAIAMLETKNVSVWEVCEELTTPDYWNQEHILDIIANYADVTLKLNGDSITDYAFTLLYMEVVKYCFKNKLDVTLK